ncbi:hypothetical protein WJX72_006880 [[Myrmecia] bisecta]|uniref:Alanine--tRNA ligase n=1 Tax=[Myrmecia] bisecta TaxID=41462 RepID=A0AAW1QR79_9CHLO
MPVLGDPTKLAIQFMFDTSSPCCVSTYVVVTEAQADGCRLSMTKQTPAACIRYEKGLHLKFPPPSADVSHAVLDLSRYDWAELSKANGDTYPLVVRLETITEKGLAEGHTLQELQPGGEQKLWVQSQTTFATLVKDEDGSYLGRGLKQKIWVEGVSYELQEIYGMGEGASGASKHAEPGREDDLEERLCVICLVNNRDTTVLPCRHMCMCRDCAQELRKQTSKCPICRNQVESLLHIKVAPSTLGNNSPDYLSKQPLGKSPSLETEDGSIFESSAIARYLATISNRTSLYPQPDSPAAVARAQIDGWVDWALSLDPVSEALVYPLLDYMPHSQPAADKAEADLKGLLTALEAQLQQQTYLVGDKLTLADVVVAAHFVPLYLAVFDADQQTAFPSTARWLATVYGHPHAVAVFDSQLRPPAKAPKYTKGPQPWGAGPIPAAALKQKLTHPWSGNRVRQTFIDFFQTKGHTAVPSSSVVPHNDPTLLFANAGMNQFKPIFLGTADPNSDFAKLSRACDAQKCIRAGGKHNDLDDVGKDVYHHTFFEMLGNWSFGDYFKKEAIGWAWELLTAVYRLNPERLYATYFGGDSKQGLEADEEARRLWLQFLPESRVLPFGCKDNFWEMGDQGPCGPCTEIHYDRIGGRDAGPLVNLDDPNVLEIWNLVFIQYNREADASLKSLPAKHVDTGMGMERLTSVLQDKVSNYATDVFAPIFEAIQNVSNIGEPYTDKVGKDDVGGKDMAYRVVADHIRTLSFAIADGSQPGNEGREYVLRRILRRAVRYGRETLKCKEGFFAGLVDSVVSSMGGFYPELVNKRDQIHSIISEEEASFSRTLVKGIERFKKAAAAAKDGKVAGKDAFELWDTYGFPVDLTQLMAEEAGLQVDMPGYHAWLEEQRERSRAGGKQGGGTGLKFEAEATAHLQQMGAPVTDDSPKYRPADVPTCLLAILSPTGFIESTADNGAGPLGLVVERTSFYAEQGGQVADTGSVASSSSTFTVTDTQVAAGYVLHIGTAGNGILRVGDSVIAQPDLERRARIEPNHTFTHVLNLALRDVLGNGVDQKGSIVLPDKLRFDFSHNGVIDPVKLGKIEAICREHVANSRQVFAKEVALSDAKAINGLRAVFGEVYPDPVRVVSIGKSVEDLLANPGDAANHQYSVEFCGGTHLANTADAKAFALLSEEGIAKGVRRVVAVTAGEAEAAIKTSDALFVKLEAAKKLSGEALEKEVSALKQVLEEAVIPAAAKASLRQQVGVLQKALLESAKKAGAANRETAIATALETADKAAAEGAKFAVMAVNVGLDPKALLEAWNAIQKKHPALPAIMFSKDAAKGKALAYAGVPEALSKQLNAGEWVKGALAVLGGKGGGKPTGAQGQAPLFEKVPEAMQTATEYASRKL